MSYLATLDRDEDGNYIDKDGAVVGGAARALGDMLGFCGCGCQEEALKYVRDALRIVNTPGDRRKACAELFAGNYGAEYFMWYMLNDKGLTEHGTSVPGWLTEVGKSVLADLEAMNLDIE